MRWTVFEIGALARLALVALVALVVAPLSAAQGEAEIKVIPSMTRGPYYVGQPIQLTLKVSGARTATQGDVPEVEWGTGRFISAVDTSRQSVFIINGRRREERFEGVELTYEFVPLMTGGHTIPPVSVNVGQRTFTTAPIQIDVLATERRDDVLLEYDLSTTTPYVGEPIELTVDLLLARQPNDIRLNAMIDGEVEVMDAPRVPGEVFIELPFLGEDTELVQSGVVVRDGRTFTALRLRKIIVPREAGSLRIGPLTAGLDLVMRRSRSPFQEPVTSPAFLSTEPVTLDVRPVPEEGRPGNFAGLIGRYELDTSVAPRRANVGDPLTLTVRVRGTQPLRLVPMPDLVSDAEFARSFRLTGDEPPGAVEDDAIVFTRTIRATEDADAFPSVEFAYFDTASGRYDVARSEPIPLDLAPARLVTAGDAVGGAVVSEALEAGSGGIGHIIEGDGVLERATPLTLARAVRSPVLIAAAASGPVTFLGAAVLVGRRRRRERGAESPAARRRRARGEALAALDAAGADPAHAAPLVASALLAYLGDRFDRAPSGLTHADCMALLGPYGEGLGKAFVELLGRCDAARFGGGETADGEALVRDARALLDRAEGVLS